MLGWWVLIRKRSASSTSSHAMLTSRIMPCVGTWEPTSSCLGCDPVTLSAAYCPGPPSRSTNFFASAARRSNFAASPQAMKVGGQSTAASMSNASKAAVVKRVQYGALPYRLRAGSARPQFMLITSRETQRWIIPKGWPKKGKSPQYSAAREAFEEAGVLGAVAKRSVGSFSYNQSARSPIKSA
jgi:hypothetical protein